MAPSTTGSQSTHLLAILCAVALSALASAETIRRVPIVRTGILSDNTLRERIVLKNVYGSTAAEILRCVQGSAFALTAQGGNYVPVWHTPRVSCSTLAAADLDEDGAQEVVVGTRPASGAGSVLIYTPHLFGAPRGSVQIPGTLGINDIAVGNVDGDAAPEIVAVTNTDTYVFDAATLNVDWTASGRGGHTVAIADIEGDGPAEIIVSGSDGHVLDGNAHTYKWGYIGGFGTSVAVGDVDADGKAEIVGVSSSNRTTVNILNGDTFTSSSFTATGYNELQALAIGDGNGDGQLEIEAGTYYSGLVRGFKVDGTIVWAITSQFWGTSAIAVGDVDGDGVNEAVWAGGIDSGPDSLLVGDPPSQTVEWSVIDLNVPLRAVAADLDGDGTMEIVVASRTTGDSYSSGGSVRVFDQQGRFLRSLTFPSTSPIMAIACGQLDADAALEVAVLSGDYYGARIWVADGVTGASEWSSPPTTYEAPGFNGNGPLLVKNVDGDPVDEIVVGTSSYQIQVLNGASAIVQASVKLDGTVNDADVADLDGDSDLDVVVGTSASFYVLEAADLAERIHTTGTVAINRVAATAGSFAVSSSGYSSTTVIDYAGDTLLERWRCTHPASSGRLRFATIGGSEWLALADASTLQFFPTAGSTCPEKALAEQAVSGIGDFSVSDVTGDGIADLLLSTDSTVELDVFGLASEPRGDADGDALVADDDLDALAAYFYGAAHGINAGADVNADFALRPDDLIRLIDYRRGTGNAPPQ